jgi:ComF family protein
MPDRVNRGLGFQVDGRGWRRAWTPWRARCLGCGEPGADGRDLCRACDAALPRIRAACATCGLPLRAPGPGAGTRGAAPGDPRCDACLRAPPPLTHVVAPFLYAAPLDRWFPRFKFHHDLAAGRLISQLMLDACAAAPRPDAIVPIPLHRARFRQRGYDQAFELAKPLSRALGLPLRCDLLARTRATSAQSSLHAAERLSNMRRAFATRSSGSALPAHVALVDDVMTTGATLHAGAHALLGAGMARVDAWVGARTP